MTDRQELDRRRKAANNAVWAFGKIVTPSLTPDEYASLRDADKEYADRYFTIQGATNQHDK
jgi:hypothetical protein